MIAVQIHLKCGFARSTSCALKKHCHKKCCVQQHKIDPSRSLECLVARRMNVSKDVSRIINLGQGCITKLYAAL